MRYVIFGLTVSSSWGNGHATLWRGLLKALVSRGHSAVFYERDVPYYALTRDLTELPGVGIRFYDDWNALIPEAESELDGADVSIVTSYCPDGREAARLSFDSGVKFKIFYDLDTPVTLKRLYDGEEIPYIPANGLSDFDLVLSYTGGRALNRLREDLGAVRTAPLFGHVDPGTHHPVQPVVRYRADLSYLGTYSADRQEALVRLFVEPARRLPDRDFLIGGAQYPEGFPWTGNIRFVRHLPPSEHPAFFSSSRITLNVTRGPMAEMGYCPSGRLFEATACGAPVLSDSWEGLESFFTPGREILRAVTTEDVLGAMELSDRELRIIATAARERTLAAHTSEVRARELETMIDASVPK